MGARDNKFQSSFHQHFRVVRINFAICFRHLMLVEIISFQNSRTEGAIPFK